MLAACVGYGLMYWGHGMINHANPQPLTYVLLHIGQSTYPGLG